jgi:hypothetical protein
MLCDRNNVNIAKSQIGFIDVIIFPAFELLSKVLPKVNVHMHNINSNRSKWE